VQLTVAIEVDMVPGSRSSEGAMGTNWQAVDGLTAWWSLSFEELGLLEAKPPHTRLGLAAQLKMYGYAGRFVQGAAEFPAGALAYLAQQTGMALVDIEAYDWQGRTSRRHRAEVLRFLGIRQSTGRDMDRALAWATKELCPLGLPPAIMNNRLTAWFAEQRVGCPEGEALDRLVATAQRHFEDQVLATVDAALSPELKDWLDSSLADADPVSGFSGLKADPGQPNLDNILLAARRLDFVRSLALPPAATLAFDNPVARILRRRVANEAAWRMRQHPQGRRHALYAVFLAHRSHEITDGLIDLLVEVVHKIGSQAKVRGQSARPGDRTGSWQGDDADPDCRGGDRAPRRHRARRGVSGRGWRNRAFRYFA
jgi:hypothetical protein